MWQFIIICALIGFTPETNSMDTPTDDPNSYGTLKTHTPEDYQHLPRINNEGILRHQLPPGRERSSSVRNYGTMVYSKGMNLGQVSECLKKFGYKE